MNPPKIDQHKSILTGIAASIVVGVGILYLGIFQPGPVAIYDAGILERLEAENQTTAQSTLSEGSVVTLMHPFSSSLSGLALSPLFDEITTISQNTRWLSEESAEYDTEQFQRVINEALKEGHSIFTFMFHLRLMTYCDVAKRDWQGALRKIQALSSMTDLPLSQSAKVTVSGYINTTCKDLLKYSPPRDIMMSLLQLQKKGEHNLTKEIDIFDKIRSNLSSRRLIEQTLGETMFGGRSVVNHFMGVITLAGVAQETLNTVLFQAKTDPQMNLHIPTDARYIGVSHSLLNPGAKQFRLFSNIPISRRFAVSRVLRDLVKNNPIIVKELEKTNHILGSLPLELQLYYLYSSQDENFQLNRYNPFDKNFFTGLIGSQIATRTAFAIEIFERQNSKTITNLNEASNLTANPIKSPNSLRQPIGTNAYLSLRDETTVSMINAPLDVELGELYLVRALRKAADRTSITISPVDDKQVILTAYFDMFPTQNTEYCQPPLLADALRHVYGDQGATVSLWQANRKPNDISRQSQPEEFPPAGNASEVLQSKWKPMAVKAFADSDSRPPINPQIFQIRLDLPMPSVVRVISPVIPFDFPEQGDKYVKNSMVLK